MTWGGGGGRRVTRQSFLHILYAKHMMGKPLVGKGDKGRFRGGRKRSKSKQGSYCHAYRHLLQSCSSKISQASSTCRHRPCLPMRLPDIALLPPSRPDLGPERASRAQESVHSLSYPLDRRLLERLYRNRPCVSVLRSKVAMFSCRQRLG